jgi:hypothetical protein
VLVVTGLVAAVCAGCNTGTDLTASDFGECGSDTSESAGATPAQMIDPEVESAAIDLFGDDYAGAAHGTVATAGTVPTSLPCPLRREDINVVEYSLIDLGQYADTALAEAPELACTGVAVIEVEPRVSTNSLAVEIEVVNDEAVINATTQATTDFFRDRLPVDSWHVEFLRYEPGTEPPFADIRIPPATPCP